MKYSIENPSDRQTFFAAFEQTLEFQVCSKGHKNCSPEEGGGCARDVLALMESGNELPDDRLVRWKEKLALLQPDFVRGVFFDRRVAEMVKERRADMDRLAEEIRKRAADLGYKAYGGESMPLGRVFEAQRALNNFAFFHVLYETTGLVPLRKWVRTGKPPTRLGLGSFYPGKSPVSYCSWGFCSLDRALDQATIEGAVAYLTGLPSRFGKRRRFADKRAKFERR